MAGEPAFFELGVHDAEQARAFYGALFGWTFEPGPADNGFAIGTPGVPGGLHGGDAGASPYLFFRVDDMDAALERVRELGGTVDEIPGAEEDPQSVAAFGCFLCAATTRARPSACTSPRIPDPGFGPTGWWCTCAAGAQLRGGVLRRVPCAGAAAGRSAPRRGSRGQAGGGRARRCRSDGRAG